MSPESISKQLDGGADVNAVGGKFGTALAMAAYRGKQEILSLLLDKGAEVNAVEGNYGTALVAAAFPYNEKIVWHLLDRGADVNAVGGHYGTALAAAVSQDRLNKEGSDSEMSGHPRTVLTAAVSQRKWRIVSLLLDRGADINVVGGECGTALAEVAYRDQQDDVSRLLTEGADPNIVTSEFGTEFGRAINEKRTDLALLLLKHGADVVRVGGSYSTSSGAYPSALDIAHSASTVDPTLLARIETLIGKQMAPGSPVDSIVSRPPFPMPYAGAISVLPSSFSPFDMSTKFRAGGNITSEQADVPCRELSEEVLRHLLAALVGLHEDTIQAKCQWIQNDIRYFVSCNFDFGLAYAAARVAWKHFNSVDSRDISIQRGRWHKHAQVLDTARSKAIEKDNSSSGQEVVISPYSIMPRRLWDLKSNRDRKSVV